MIHDQYKDMPPTSICEQKLGHKSQSEQIAQEQCSAYTGLHGSALKTIVETNNFVKSEKKEKPLRRSHKKIKTYFVS